MQSWPSNQQISLGHLLGTSTQVHDDTSHTYKDQFIKCIACSSKDSTMFNGGEEYTIVREGNVQILFGGKMLNFLNVCYGFNIEISLLAVNKFMRHLSLTRCQLY